MQRNTKLFLERENTFVYFFNLISNYFHYIFYFPICCNYVCSVDVGRFCFYVDQNLNLLQWGLSAISPHAASYRSQKLRYQQIAYFILALTYCTLCILTKYAYLTENNLNKIYIVTQISPQYSKSTVLLLHFTSYLQ